MVVIRLARGGSKKNPYYHIVAADKRYARDGRYIERLGFYNPMARGQEKQIELVSERLNYWVKQGAQPSDRVLHLMKTFARIAKGEVKPLPTKAEMKKAQQESAEKAAAAAKKQAEAEAKKAEAAAKEETPAENPAESEEK